MHRLRCRFSVKETIGVKVFYATQVSIRLFKTLPLLSCADNRLANPRPITTNSKAGCVIVPAVSRWFFPVPAFASLPAVTSEIHTIRFVCSRKICSLAPQKGTLERERALVGAGVAGKTCPRLFAGFKADGSEL